jgi:salicylate hydroxylase
MYRDIEEKLASKRDTPYTDKFKAGLPIGMKLPNGVTIGA